MKNKQELLSRGKRGVEGTFYFHHKHIKADIGQLRWLKNCFFGGGEGVLVKNINFELNSLC